MSPTLYTLRNNGEENNGGNTTMVIGTTMINNGMEYGGIQSVFPCFCHGVISDGIGQQGGDMEGVGLGEDSLPAMWWDIQGIA